MTEFLRVGILGAGWAGEGHAVAFSKLPNVTVAALWSRTRSRAEVLAGKLNQSGLQIYDHWQDLIEQADVDIISLGTPPTLRREPLTMALERGRHVLVEKPFSTGLDEALAMVELDQQANVVTAVSFNWRYAPAFQMAWHQVQAGRIGQVHDVRTEWRWRVLTSEFFVQRPWVARLDIGDGTVGEGISHDFDKTRFLTGGDFSQIVSRIAPYSFTQDEGYTIDSGSHTHLAELSNGILGSFRFTVTAGEDEWSLVLSGDQGTLRMNFGDSIIRQRADEAEPVSLEIPESEQIPSDANPMQHTWNLLIADFVKAIRAGDVAHISVPHLPTLVDGLHIQEVVVAARRSENERRWVNLAEIQ